MLDKDKKEEAITGGLRKPDVNLAQAKREVAIARYKTILWKHGLLGSREKTSRSLSLK